MATYTEVKQKIQQWITSNANREVTAQVMRDMLNFLSDWIQLDNFVFIYKCLTGFTFSELSQITDNQLLLVQTFKCKDDGRIRHWKYVSGDISTVNGGTVVVTTTGKKLIGIFKGEDTIKTSWFAGLGTVNDEILQKCLDLAFSVKLPVLMNTELVQLSTGVFVPYGVRLYGLGVETTIVEYSGTGVAINADRTGETYDIFEQNIFDLYTLKAVGSAKTSTTAEGLKIGNCFGTELGTLFIRDFESGKGFHMCNNKYWTEGTLIRNLNLRNNKVSWAFTVEDEALDNGYYSFCNTRALHVNIVTVDGQAGILMDENAHVYASTMFVKGNFEGTGQNQTGLLMNKARMDFGANIQILFEGDSADFATNRPVGVKLTNQSIISGLGTISQFFGNVNLVCDSTSIVKLNSYNSNNFNLTLNSSIKKIKLITLKATDDTSNNEKIKVDVWGGGWLSDQLGSYSYFISSRNGVRVYEEGFGNKYGYAIKVFQNVDNTFDVCLYVNVQFPSLDFKCYLLENFVTSEILYSSGNSNYNYDDTGKTDVTPQFLHRNYITFSPQSLSPSTPYSNEFRLFSNSTGQLSWKGGDSYTRQLKTTGITNDRIWTLPNKDGQFELLNEATLTINQDGVLQLCVGASLEGFYKLEYTASNRKQYLIFQIVSHQYSDAYINIIADYAFNNAKVFSNIRVVGSSDGATRCLVVDVGNRTTATDIVRVTGLSYSTGVNLSYSPSYSTSITNYKVVLDKSIIPDKKTTSELSSITNKEEATIFYDSTAKKLKFWNGTAFETITSV